MPKRVIVIPLEEVQPPDHLKRAHFRVDATPALSLPLKEEALAFAKAVCSTLVEAGIGDSISFQRAAYDVKANRLILRGSALPAAFEQFDALFPPSQRASLKAADDLFWSVAVSWVRRPLSYQLLLANVPECSPELVQTRLRGAGLDVQSVSFAPTALATFTGSRNFSAFLVVVVAHLDQLPTSLRFEAGSKSFDVRVDRYFGGRIVGDAAVDISPSWASVVASAPGASPPTGPSSPHGDGVAPLGPASPPAAPSLRQAESSADAPPPHLPEPAAPGSAVPEPVAPEPAAPEPAAPESVAPASAAPEPAGPESAAPEISSPCVSPPSLAVVPSPCADSGPADPAPAFVEVVAPPSVGAPSPGVRPLACDPIATVVSSASSHGERDLVRPPSNLRPPVSLGDGGPLPETCGPPNLALAVVAPVSRAVVLARRASPRARPRSRSPPHSMPPRPIRGKRAKGLVDGATPQSEG